MNAGKVLGETAQRLPHKTAVIFKDEKISFSDLDLMANRLANKLQGLDIKKGDRVAIVLPNSPQWVVAYFAVMRLGAIGVPLDFRLKVDELLPVLKDAQIKVVVTSAVSRYHDVFSKAGNLKGMIVAGEETAEGVLCYQTIIGDDSLSASVQVDVREEEDAIYLYTSGTSGKPKGVVLTFANLSLFPEAMTEICKTSECDVIGCLLPMSHISGPILCNESVVRGSTLVIFDQLRPDKIMAAIERHRVTYFHSVPPIFEALLHVSHRERFDVSSLRFVAMMGTSVPLDLLKEFKKAFPPVPVIQGYGLTETSPFITLLPPGCDQEKLGSIGLAVPHAEIKLVDERGVEVPSGDVGELIVRGPMLMKEYHNNPKATRERIRNGWLYTGDLCKKDKDDFYYHIGRKDDMIIVGGLNVYPAEVEQVLRGHPLLQEVGVVGLPDKDRGSVIKAAIVTKPGEEVSKKEIVSYCKKRLASFKIPKIVEFWDELPKARTGKIARRLLVNSKCVTDHH